MRLHDLITRYVAFRRTLGERCETNERILRSFSRVVGPQIAVERITVAAVTNYLNGNRPITNGWYSRYHAVKGLFQFAVSRSYRTDLPLPTVFPKRSPQFVPHIYSRDELRRLLEAIAPRPGSRTRVLPQTIRAILLTLYGAGLRVSEVLRLTIADVDLPNAILTIRDTKFFKSRLVPISHDLTQLLVEYDRWSTTALPPIGSNDRFFRGHQGTTITYSALGVIFRQLRTRAGVSRSSAPFQPRLHDLRHTFAVHRLIAWYRDGADVPRLIYHLSVYLGHNQLSSTQVYLTLVPELLTYAAARFEQYAHKESHHA